MLQELRRVGARNPLFVIDELDRLSERDDLPAALLELFDSAQRSRFRDRYLELPIDLSEVLLVVTANRLRPVPSMLCERFKVVDVPGYTPEEKRAVAVEHLLPAAVRGNGLAAGDVEVTDEALRSVIRGYAWDPGLWSLLSEEALAHTESDSTVAAYTDRAVLLDERVPLMQQWADYVLPSFVGARGNR